MATFPAFPKDTPVVDLYPNEFYEIPQFRSQDLANQKQYGGMWSTYSHLNLHRLNIETLASSTLAGHYEACNLLDGRATTARVEGEEDDGVGQFIHISLTAEKPSVSSTPFSVYGVGVVPGYAKSTKTWQENNRVKTALLIVHSDPPAIPRELEWVAYRLHFADDSLLQYFELDFQKAVGNQDPIKEDIWLRIEEVYRGTKYRDTAISEVVLVGGCLA